MEKKFIKTIIRDLNDLLSVNGLPLEVRNKLKLIIVKAESKLVSSPSSKSKELVDIDHLFWSKLIKEATYLLIKIFNSS